MKKNTRMDLVLDKAVKDPIYLKEIIPVFQSFAHYGGVKPYFHYQNKIIEICNKWQESTEMAIIVSYLTKAYVQVCLGQYAKAQKHISELTLQCDLKINNEHYAFAESMLGVCMRDKGEIDKALVHFLNVVNILDKHSPLAHFRSYAFYFIAEIHMQINEIEVAGKYYQKALKIAQKVDDKISAFRSRIGLGKWYQHRNKHKKSVRFFKDALKMESVTLASRSRVLRDLGTHYLSIKKYKKSIKYLKKSYHIAMEEGFSNPASTCLINLGKVYSETGKPKKALKVLKEALEISLEHKTSAKQMEIESLLATTYKELGNYEKAFIHLKVAQRLKEGINSEKQSEIFKIKNRLIREQKEVIKKERNRSDRLLLNILPESIASELKENQVVQPKRYEQVSVLFSDFVGFTSISESMSSQELVENLDTYFRAFDKIITKYGLEKIKTIGDAYMCAGGLPGISKTHARDTVKAGLEMQDYVKEKNKWQLRIGIHTGPVIAGVVGDIKFAYDIWGDTVNTASRMESSGESGKVNVSKTTFNHLVNNHEFNFIARGKIKAKNKNTMEMYFVESEL